MMTKQRNSVAEFVVRVSLFGLALFVLCTESAFAADPGGATPVNEEELHQYCDLRADQLDDPTSQQGCVKTCVTSLGITASKAQTYHHKAMLALLIGLVAALAFCAVGYVIVSKKGALADWSGSKINLIRLIIAVVALAIGFGAGKVLHDALAYPHLEALYQDLMTFKKAGKAEAQSADGNMVCSEAKLKALLEAEVAGSNTTSTSPGLLAMAEYTGIFNHFDKLQAESGAKMDKRGIDDRWRDVSSVMLAASSIKVDAGVTAEVIRSSKVFENMSDNVPFPKTALIAGAIGAIAGILVGFGIRRATA